MKHLEFDNHFFQSLVRQGFLHFVHVSTKDQLQLHLGNISSSRFPTVAIQVFHFRHVFEVKASQHSIGVTSTQKNVHVCYVNYIQGDVLNRKKLCLTSVKFGDFSEYDLKRKLCTIYTDDALYSVYSVSQVSSTSSCT